MAESSQIYIRKVTAEGGAPDDLWWVALEKGERIVGVDYSTGVLAVFITKDGE